MRSISHRLVIDYTPQTLSSNIFSQSISDVKIYEVFDDNNSEKGIELACRKPMYMDHDENRAGN